mmetsp:Transcript_18077/g.56086  ORF Transcript_18077/g.56086 Transcript_18077/m.56086 type:complete len:239 (+) Transcript_18077:110-826(+)
MSTATSGAGWWAAGRPARSGGLGLRNGGSGRRSSDPVDPPEVARATLGGSSPMLRGDSRSPPSAGAGAASCSSACALAFAAACASAAAASGSRMSRRQLGQHTSRVSHWLTHSSWNRCPHVSSTSVSPSSKSHRQMLHVVLRPPSSSPSPAPSNDGTLGATLPFPSESPPSAEAPAAPLSACPGTTRLLYVRRVSCLRSRSSSPARAGRCAAATSACWRCISSMAASPPRRRTRRGCT